MAEDEQAELDDEDSPLEPGSLEAERYNVEILRGVQLMSPRPAAPHAKVAASLLISLGNEFSRGRGGGPGGDGWWILFEPDLPMPDGDLLIPDLAGWREVRLPALPRSGPIPVKPDWVCEILSRSTRRNDRRVKLPIYFAAGIEHVWLVDPLSQRLERFKRGADSYQAVAVDTGDVSIHAAPFAGFALDLSEIWRYG